jgi:hypothetical protein
VIEFNGKLGADATVVEYGVIAAEVLRQVTQSRAEKRRAEQQPDEPQPQHRAGQPSAFMSGAGQGVLSGAGAASGGSSGGQFVVGAGAGAAGVPPVVPAAPRSVQGGADGDDVLMHDAPGATRPGARTQ